jgi:trimeric autotransporter adhesin
MDGPAILGATTATLTIDPVALLDEAMDYNVVISGECGLPITSNNASLTVNSAPEITLQPADQEGCEGESVTFTVEATGANLTYQWRRGTLDLMDGPAILGATTATLTIDPVALLDEAMDYNVVISGECGLPITSLNASLEVDSPPEIIQQPTSQLVCGGDMAIFAVEATGKNLTYQWRRGIVNLVDGDAISGATTATLTIDPIEITDAADNYNVVLSGTCSSSVISNNASLTVNTAPVITLQPANQTGCVGTLVSFNIEATGTDISYQWRRDFVNLTNSGNISGATNSTLTIDPVDASDEAPDYDVVISGACGSPLTSNNASLVVNSLPEISAQPENQMECAGGTASFSVTATGTDISYQWRKGTVNLTDAENISGATTSTFTIYPVSIDDAAENYNVVVSGVCAPVVFSDDVSLEIGSAPEVSLQPANQEGCVGSLVSFTIEATGTDLSYQWRRDFVNLTNSGNISGATSATLTINPIDVSDGEPDYDVVVTGACGLPVASNNASLVVNISPEITEQPINQTSNAGGVASFSVTAIGKDIRFQWRRGTVNLTVTENILGATSSTLIIDPVSEADAAEDYNVVVSGGCEPAVTSNNVTLTVNPTGINAIDSGNALTFYPNPFNSSVNIKLNDALQGNEFHLRIYNILGVLIVKTTIFDQSTTVETGHFVSGIYFYQVIDNNKVIQTGKLIKQK